MDGLLSLVIGLNILCSLFHFSNPASIHVTTRKTTAHHHATHKATTHHTTTPRPTHESGEWSYTFYYYDSVSHYFCGYHSSRVVSKGYCLCYHVPYENRADIHSPLTLMKMETHIYELYRSGNHVITEDLQFYSKPNYDMCHNHGKRPNVTTYLLYD
ncbi:uncharacterized protein LOC125676077 [Ostrea edulis]|uniref:uncharacterized protein LOC125676077 n=1 Tax=Ostrea edulis TaxID=37623 RepID=UPI002096461F|nr:uncharacterized protein LOC125676077 [Ostrea edulis]